MSTLEAELEELKSKYSHTLTRDEALNLALESAELHMKFLRLATRKAEKSELTEKTHRLLDDAEKIRNANIWDLSSFESIHSSSSIPGPLTPKNNIDNGASIASSYQTTSAQSAPSFSNGQGRASLVSSDDTALRTMTLQKPPVPPNRIQAPISSRDLPKAERILLLRSSKLNGNTFPPWEIDPVKEDFQRVAGETLFLDACEYAMSEGQRDILDDWKRPEAAVPPPTWQAESLTQAHQGPTMQMLNKPDFVQDAATDCSVVASLAAATARMQKGRTSILSSLFFPYDAKTQQPGVAANGKYVFRLNFNGCLRKVVIDDRLPVSQSQRVLHLFDRNNPSLLWPALVEKAYLKIRGGYDFPGSNSGTDLWILSGWIPEQLFLQHDETDSNKLWPRMYTAFGYGDIIITIGTGKITPKAEFDSGLAGEHDYAVLDLRESGGRQMVLIKNPWLNATTWKDRRLYTNAETVSPQRSPALVAKLLSDFGDDDEEELAPGTFWMEMSDVMQHFESIYLNWNPEIFRYRQDIHFEWDLQRDRSAVGSFIKNPQQLISASKDTTIWLVLSKHFTANGAKRPAEDEEGFISLYAFETDGHRVHFSKGALKQGLLVDSPQTLLKLDALAHTKYTIVPSEETLPSRLHVFTLSAFSMQPISLNHAPPKYKTKSTQESSWTKATAGGNAQSETYSQNPQFSLHLPGDSAVSLFLETLIPHISVHVKLMHGRGERVYSGTSRDIVVDSGDYRRGCVQARIENMKSGMYTIICSTFETGQLANFTLQVESNTNHQVKWIPRDGAGKIRTRLADASLRAGVRLLAAPLIPRRITRASFVAKYVPAVSGSPGSSKSPESSELVYSPTRMTIELGRGPDRCIVVVSGGGSFSESPWKEIRLGDVDLNPSMSRRTDMWLVLERLSGFEGTKKPEQRLGVEMFADTGDAIDIGVWREFER